MAEEPKKRRSSHVLEYLKKQQEAHEAAKAEHEKSGGDTPFPDFSPEFGLGGLTGDSKK